MNAAKLYPHEVMGFDQYAICRKEIRAAMIAKRKLRSVSLTDNIRVAFENRATVVYQIQEVLYAAKCSDNEEISAQIEMYKHLLPGHNSLTATLLMEYEDGGQAAAALSYFSGIEKNIYLEVHGEGRVWPICNEDLQCQDILSPVHYLRYDFTSQMLNALKGGAGINLGIAHYRLPIDGVGITTATHQSLLRDLNV